jgi:hypothetical protein
MSYKMIKNEHWTVSDLAAKVKNNEIRKPKFQRKRKWDLFEKKENVPSERKYIEFLYETHNSVHAITFGEESGKLTNIDGNNRINAIIHFLKEPFVLFPEKTHKINQFIEEKINKDVAEELDQLVKKMEYKELMNFRYEKYFIEHGSGALYNRHLKLIRDEVLDFFEELIADMKINKTDFDVAVKINVNLFTGYNTQELAQVFGKINKYNSKLTEQESLASMLFNLTDFALDNKGLECEIKIHIQEFYKDMSKNEELQCFEFEPTDAMNAYDFMVGFQNYVHSKCSLIEKVAPGGSMSLFFTLFDMFYKGGFNTTFNTKNVNHFIGSMTQILRVLIKFTEVFLKKITEGNAVSAPELKKRCTKTAMLIIISAVYGYLNKNTEEQEIISSLEKAILYHIIIKECADKNQQKIHEHNDLLTSYSKGGNYAVHVPKKLHTEPENVSIAITKEKMHHLLESLLKEVVCNKINSDKKERRKRTGFEKILIYYYYKCKVPTEYLAYTYSYEHLFPFSSNWDRELDIDRIGNIFPVIDSLNKFRSNLHIKEYRKITENKTHKGYGFLKYIDTVPSVETYDSIVNPQHKTPIVFNNENFNLFCEENERKLMDCFLQCMFKY